MPIYRGDIVGVLAELKALSNGNGAETEEYPVGKTSIPSWKPFRKESHERSARAESSLLRLINRYGETIYTLESATKFVDWLNDSSRSVTSVHRYLGILKPVAPELFGHIPKLKGAASLPAKLFTREKVKRVLDTLKNDRRYSH